MCSLLFDMGSGLKDNKNTIYEMTKSNNGWGTTQGMSKKLIWFHKALLIFFMIEFNSIPKYFMKKLNICIRLKT